ncbi:MAG: hypothetical protein V1826_01515, partial [bacterium]
LLTDNARQVAFGYDGGEIVYIHEPAGGEYSLVRSWPEGLEWERVVLDLPRLTNPRLVWGTDNRYLLIASDDKLVIADLIAQTITDNALADWMPGSQVAISTEGNRVAYVAQVDGVPAVKLYDLDSEQTMAIADLSVANDAAVAWMDNSTILVALPNQVFKKIDVERDVRSTIPVTGDTGGKIKWIEYSQPGRVLMVVTDKNVLTLKV